MSEPPDQNVSTPPDPWRTLTERLGLPMEAMDRLRIALTHKSAVEGAAGEHYERLEFLGDSVLGLIVNDELYHEFPEAAEGVLTRLKTNVVSEPSLAAAARELELGEHVILSRGEELAGGQQRPSILSDVFESVLAVIYLTEGLEAARWFVREHLLARTDVHRNDNFKSLLQEYTQEHFHTAPRYTIAESSGPEHERLFVAEVSLRDTVLGRGAGRSKKQAEQQAAAEAYRRLREEPSGAPSEVSSAKSAAG
jgi:ribonuclease III